MSENHGVYVLLEIREKLIENAEGEVVGIRSALIDVTERNKFFSDMQRSHDRMRFALQSSTRAIVIADAIGNVDFMNPAAEALTGWRLSDALGRGLDEICPLLHTGEDADLLSCIRTEPALRTLTKDACVMDRSGARHPVVGTVSAICSDQNVIVGVTLVIEERRQLDLRETSPKDGAAQL
jgi:PAS domain S-box-containing protein